MARVEGDVCLRPRDLERLKRVMLELAGLLDEYLDSVNGSKEEPRQSSSNKQPSKQSGKHRNKYVFNKAIIAVLRGNGCMSESDLWNALSPRDRFEERELEDAFKYLADKGAIVLDRVQGCWSVRG